MEDRAVRGIQTVIRYIESRLGGRLELETVAEAVHYSKYHLHRMFTETVGMTLHDYVQRRRLTEAAKLLAFPDGPSARSLCSADTRASSPSPRRLRACTRRLLRPTGRLGTSIPSSCPLPSVWRGAGKRSERRRSGWQKREIPCLDGADASGDRRLSRHGRGGVSGAAAGEHSRRTRPGPGGG